MNKKPLAEMTPEEKAEFRAEALRRYYEFCERKLHVDMSRGKPSKEQLDISDRMLTELQDGADCISNDGFDCRSYGNPAGVRDCRELFANLLHVDVGNIIACGNSSLSLIYDFLSQCMTHGAGSTPWSKLDEVKFIAIVPGYDRHFAMAQHFGIKMINSKLTPTGPNMDEIEELIKDPSVKGMFCVPKYSNPDGVTYDAETCERLAAMKPAAEDFRVIWDNAYCVHDLYEDRHDHLRNIFKLARKYGTQDHFIEFSSTSKITFPGSGVSVIAASERNVEMILNRMHYQTISYDKLNQLRHVKVFGNVAGIKLQMKRHAAILRPKFEAVEQIFEEELGGLGIAHWSKPVGGYFISLEVTGGSATTVGTLCQDAGLTLTKVGATYPYGYDPDDSNIRVAPTYPPLDELKISAELLAVAVKIACSE